MPLQDYELMLLITNNCPAKCDICYLNSDMERIEKMNVNDMKSYVRIARAYGCTHLCLTGGEPFLFKDDILEVIKLSNELGYYIDIRTNGFWANNYNDTITILSELKKEGLNRIGTSFDKYHNKVPGPNIKNIIRSCEKLGIKIYVDKNATKNIVASQLEVDESIIRSCIPPIRIGKANKLNKNEFLRIQWTHFRDSCGKDIISTNKCYRLPF